MSQTAYDHVYRRIGAPIDIVTGANIRQILEFRLAGPIDVEWRRYYHSLRTEFRGPFGWGHTHEYHRHLRMTVDGIAYLDPLGESFEFPFLSRDRESAECEGLTLERLSISRYRLREGRRIFDFAFDDFQKPAPLQRCAEGEAQISFQYDDSGLLREISTSWDRSVRVQSTPQGWIEALFLEAKGAKPRSLGKYKYDGSGNLVEATDPYGNSFRFAYDAKRRMTRKTDRRGYSFEFEYDEDGRCVRSRGQDGLREIRLSYLAAEKTTVVSRSDGSEWTFFYDANRMIQRIVDPYGGVESFLLDEQGRLSEVIDANNNSTAFVYGGGDAPIAKITPAGAYVPLPEEPPGFDPSFHRLPQSPAQWEYGDLLTDRGISLLSEADPAWREFPGHVASLAKKAAANRNASPLRNELGLLLSEAHPEGAVRRWSYDPNGLVHAFVDYEGQKHTREHKSWNLLASETDPLGHTVSYEYTPYEKHASVVDAGLTRTEYAYDLKDRLVRVSRHGSVREEYRYDRADNLVEKVDGEGKALLGFEIGPANLVVARSLASGDKHVFEYDAAGRYASVSTDKAEVSFSYDKSGNRVRDFRDGVGTEHEFDHTTLARTTVFGRFQTRYTRNLDGSFTIQDPTGKVHTLQIRDGGLVVRDTSDGIREIAQFDPSGRLVFRTTTFGDGRFWERRYGYSLEGHLREIADNESGEMRCALDAAYRLESVEYSTGYRERYAYDKADNLLEMPGLTGVRILDGNRLGEANGERFEYDRRNHVCLREGRNGKIRYSYDSRDMLVGIETPRGRWEAEYDALGRRTQKAFGDRWTQFHWDTDRLIAEIDQDERLRLYVYPDAFSLTPFLFLDYRNVQDDPASGRAYFVHCNHLAAPILVTDSAGRTAWRAHLQPYGAVCVAEGEKFHMPLRFPGHYFDAETGLHYNRFRYYDPVLGRYLQSDPQGLAGGMNLYACTKNPLDRVDLRGLDCEPPPKKKEGEDAPNKEKPPAAAPASAPASAPADTPPRKPYPPPTEGTEATGRQILQLIEENKNISKKDSITLGVVQHGDGSFTVALSGQTKKVQRFRESLQKDKRFPPNVKFTCDELPPQEKAVIRQTNNDDGSVCKTGQDCAEPKLFYSVRQETAPEKKKVVGMSILWREAVDKGVTKSNPHKDSSDPTGVRMCACASCRDNSGIIQRES